jgi:hypothetical protein
MYDIVISIERCIVDALLAKSLRFFQHRGLVQSKPSVSLRRDAEQRSELFLRQAGRLSQPRKFPALGPVVTVGNPPHHPPTPLLIGALRVSRKIFIHASSGWRDNPAALYKRKERRRWTGMRRSSATATR